MNFSSFALKLEEIPSFCHFIAFLHLFPAFAIFSVFFHLTLDEVIVFLCFFIGDPRFTNLLIKDGATQEDEIKTINIFPNVATL
ncbi:hypothetical protein ACJX0J_033079, partial [Zea mays]